MIAQLSPDQQASLRSIAAKSEPGNSNTCDARVPSQKTDDEWFIRNIKMVAVAGYRVTPVYDNGAAKPYADGETYDNPSDPCWRQAVMIGVVLDDALLLDYDGNKASDSSPIISLDDLASELNLPELPEPVQHNQQGDSLHYLFRVPSNFNAEEYKQANNGGWLPHVDLKRGNQLVNLKPHKLLPAGGLPAKDQLPEAPQSLLQALHRGPVSPNDTDHKQAHWDGSRGEVEEAHEILQHIPIEDSYDGWLDVMMRIHDKFGDTAEGIEVADEWSKQSEHYDRDEIVYTLASFSSADDGRPRKSWGALCKRAGENGADLSALAKKCSASQASIEIIEGAPRDVSMSKAPSTADPLTFTEVEQLTARYYYVQKDNKYFDVVTRELHESTVLNKVHARCFPGSEKTKTASRAIDLSPGKRVIDGVGWMPCEHEVIELDGKTLANTYRGITTEPVAGFVFSWLLLVQHVCGEYADLFLDHLAYTFQHPDKKIRWQILIVSEVRRTGKSLIFRVVKQLLGDAIRVVSADDLNTGWGDHFYQRKVIIVEELYERKGSQLFDKLKSRLANDDVEAINLKGGAIRYQPNLLSIYMTTNHYNALQFDESEDKLLVIRGPDNVVFPRDRVASDTFYEALGAWSDSQEGKAATLEYLLNRDLSQFNPNRLPVRTTALKEVCKQSSPDYQRYIADQIDAGNAPFNKDFTNLEVIRRQLHNENYKSFSDKGVVAALKSAGWTEKQAQKSIKNQKYKARYWVPPNSAAAAMTPSQLWDHTHPLAMKAP